MDDGGKYIAEREIVTGRKEKVQKKMKKVAKKFGKPKFFIVSLQSRSVIGSHR